jgi:chloride channel protein, CIC family
MTNEPASISKWRDVPTRRWNEFLRQREEHLFLVLSLLIGALVGGVVVAFIVLTQHVGIRLYPAEAAVWRRLLIPILGSLVMGYLLFKYFPDARGSGVPQTKAALYARGGYISLTTVIGKFFCTSATLASGIPLGREGPAVQVGAGISSVLGRWLRLSPEKVKALLPVGAAAAIAAAFNTPLAAVLFALEEVVGDLHAQVLGSVVLASATSWGVLRLLLGNDPLFQVPQYQLVHPVEFLVYAVLGVLGGFVSVAFTKLLLSLRKKFLKLPKKTLWFQPVSGGLVVALMAWFVPQVLGVGYQHVGAVLNGNMALKLMALLLVLKLVGVIVSYASGNAGGIFGPSLFIGAMLGGVVGTLAQHVLPGYVAAPGAYALVGMGTAFAGIVRAPMTSVLMIFETTRDYSVIVPLMISNLVSFFISSRLQREPIYEALAQQDGIHLPKAASRSQSIGHHVFQVMRPAPKTLGVLMTAGEALQSISSNESRTWLVSDDTGVVGVLSRKILEKAASDGGGTQLLRELVNLQEFPHVHPDHSLSLALERMGMTEMDALPVVSRANVHKLEGLITLEDVLAIYGAPTRSA